MPSGRADSGRRAPRARQLPPLVTFPRPSTTVRTRMRPSSGRIRVRPARLAVCRQQMQQHHTTCCLVLVTAARRAPGSPGPRCGQPTAGADWFACAGCHARHRQAERGRQLSALRAIFGLVVWGGAVAGLGTALPRVANAGRGREQPVLAACRTLWRVVRSRGVGRAACALWPSLLLSALHSHALLVLTMNWFGSRAIVCRHRRGRIETARTDQQLASQSTQPCANHVGTRHGYE